MGSFYTNHTVRGASQQDLLEWLGPRSALVSKTFGNTSVLLDAACESQDSRLLAKLAAQVSSHFACPVLAMLNHDDDILYFELYESGKKTDEYNSNPNCFDEDDDVEPGGPVGGDAVRLCGVFGAGDPVKVEAILRSLKFVFARERHRALAEALALPLCAVGFGYNYASADDTNDSADAGFRHTSA